MNRPRPFTVFLDRDGTLIEDDYPMNDPARLRYLPGVFGGLRLLLKAGARLVLTTNQGAIGIGRLRAEELERVHQAMSQQLAGRGIVFRSLMHCPHDPADKCQCRKPQDGMVRQARMDLDLGGDSFVVGDKGADVGLGRAVKARTVLLPRGDGGSLMEGWDMKPDFRARNFSQAVSWILSRI